MIKLSIFLLSLTCLLCSCTGDSNLLLASNKCTKVMTQQFDNSIFQSNGEAKLYNEGMMYRNDGSNKSPGSAFLDTVLTKPKDESGEVLQAYGAFNGTPTCISDESGIITYSLNDGKDKPQPLGHFAFSNCSFQKVSGDTYKFHADFIAGANPDGDQNIEKYKGYIKPKGVVEFTCDNK